MKDRVIKILMDLTNEYQTNFIELSNLYLELALLPWWRFKKRDEINNKIIKLIYDQESATKLDSLFSELKEIILKDAETI